MGIHAAGHHGVEYKSRMELETGTQNQNNKLSASVVPTFTKNVKVGHLSLSTAFLNPPQEMHKKRDNFAFSSRPASGRN